jgi:hypothetical protein
MIRLSVVERVLLEALAERTGLTLSDAARQAIRNEAERRGLKVARPKRKK